MTKEVEKDTEPKVFDRAICFTFFGNWVEAIEDMETEADRDSAAYMLFKAIADYSMYSEAPDFSNVAVRTFKPFWPILQDQIDSSQKRRKAGFREVESSEAHKKVVEAYARNPKASEREIAKITGVPKSTVHRIVTQCKREVAALSGSDTLDRSGSSKGDCSFVSFHADDTSIDTGSDNDNDSMGHGQRGAVGQFDTSVSGEEISSEEREAIFKRLSETYERGKHEYTSTPSEAVLQWRRNYHSNYRQSVNQGSGKADMILRRYLQDHAETQLEKKFGDKYGRYIIGWDNENMEPVISYSFSYVPQDRMKHNIDAVPMWYAAPDSKIRNEAKQYWMKEHGMLKEFDRLGLDQSKDADGLPF